MKRVCEWDPASFVVREFSLFPSPPQFGAVNGEAVKEKYESW
jgi:hypothetical protein